MIEQFISILSTEMELSAEEIADILWLACVREQSFVRELSVVGEKPFAVSPLRKVSTAPIDVPLPELLPKPLPELLPKPLPEPLPKPLPEPLPVEPVAKSILIQLLTRVPNPPLIRRSLTLARALQPLRQGVFSRTNGVLDEVATAQRIAEQQAWTPVLQSRLEPRLEVALVVDKSASGVIWHSTIVEMKKFLENYGIFKNVQTWGLIKDQQGQIKIRPGLSFSR